jgi:hypothetical protein
MLLLILIILDLNSLWVSIIVMQLKMVEIYFWIMIWLHHMELFLANYLKELLGIQEKLIIKPVRYLTKKHIYPSNLEKMKVRLAVQIFSPPLTAALRYIAHHGGEEFAYFKDCSATVKYMENIYIYTASYQCEDPP